MNILVLLAVVAVFGFLRFTRANLLLWALAWWVGIYVLLRFGFTVPIPASVVSLYMGIVTLAIVAYVSSSEERRDEVSRPLVRFMTEKRYTALLGATVVAIPALAAANVYVKMNVPLEPPLFPRTIHPASPSEITVHDKKIDLDAGENPFLPLQTSNPEEFRKHVENGRRVYYRNCVFCHGDNMTGNGMFVHGLDPIPTNFSDQGAIAMLRDSFLFWRIAKGGPGLPEEGAPWDSAMPAWEKLLKEDEILGSDPLSLRFHRPEASGERGGPRTMTSALIYPRAVGCLAVLVVMLCAAPAGSVRAQAPDVGTEAQRESGKRLYLKYCSQCHGENGDGEGYASPHLRPRPRNFTTGKYKVRTTPNGALPTHQDLVSIIRRGMPYTSMPGWPILSDQEVSDLAHFLTTFSPDFTNPENVPKPVPLPSAPASTNESIALGKKLYEENGCVKCHGTVGRGDGPSAPTLIDDWGYPIRAADLAQSWTFRGGSSREDIFRTMSTGLNGTPMPSFLDALPPEQLWAITDFIVSLSGTNGPGYSNLVVAKYVQDPIDLKKGAASFESARVARFPIIGQIMEPGRAFHPPASSVTVQAIYDAESMAFLVRWHDMSAQKTGKNGPSLPVPPEEEEEPAVGAASGSGGASKGSVFGEEEVAPTPAGQKPGGAQPAAADPFAEAEAAPAGQPSEFSDAVSIQIPTQAPTGARKPYFIFGDAQNSVDLWFFDLARPDPLQFTGKGSGDIAPNATGDLTGVASYDQGEWSVIFKRPLRAASGAAFVPGQFLPIAFSVWDGFSRERGNRRGLTVWYSLYVEPQVVPSAVGPMVKTALFILAIELAVIGWVRWRYGSRARGKLGDEPSHPAATSA